MLSEQEAAFDLGFLWLVGEHLNTAKDGHCSQELTRRALRKKPARVCGATGAAKRREQIRNNADCPFVATVNSRLDHQNWLHQR